MKKIKILAAAILSFMAVASASAQDAVVYLNNGSVIQGQIVKNDRDSVVIRQADGRVYGYKAIDVRDTQISGSVVKPEDGKRPKYVDYSSQEKGWWCAAGLYGGYVLDSNNQPGFGFLEVDFVNGYRFNEFIRIGIGLGARYYMGIATEDQRKPINNPWSFPIYLDLRGSMISQYSRNYAPYWQMDLGYAINDGFFVSPTIGMRFGGRRSNVLVGINYLGQMMNRNVGGEAKSAFTSAICLRVSYEF